MLVRETKDTREYIVWNPVVKRFEHLITKYKKVKVRERWEYGWVIEKVEYAKPSPKGLTHEGYEVYYLWDYIIIFNPVEEEIVDIRLDIAISVSFSIDTGGGHEPFACEVTGYTTVSVKEKDLDTAVDEAVDEMEEFIKKILYIMYDIQKDIPKRHWIGEAAASIKRRLIWRVKFGRVDKGEVEKWWRMIERYIHYRARREYISEKAEKIGVEYMMEEMPEYPKVKFEIEQNKPSIRRYEFEVEL